jgi:PE family
MSSFVIAAPEAFAAASSNLNGIGSALSAANAAAATSTTQMLPAAGDEVSAAVARLFGSDPGDVPTDASGAGGGDGGNGGSGGNGGIP